MSNVNKSNKLYKTPFTPSYWRDAAAELKDTKMLVFAALMIAIRVALKLVAIPLVLMTILFICVPSLISSVGTLMLVSGAITIGHSFILFKKEEKQA